MAIGKPSLIVHTVYFPVDDVDSASDPERTLAQSLGENSTIS